MSVSDAELPQNAEPFTITFDHGIANVGAGAAQEHATLDTDASTFAQLYAGEILPSDAVRLRRACISGAAQALDAVFRVSREFRLLDEF